MNLIAYLENWYQNSLFFDTSAFMLNVIEHFLIYYKTLRIEKSRRKTFFSYAVCLAAVKVVVVSDRVTLIEPKLSHLAF